MFSRPRAKVVSVCLNANAEIGLERKLIIHAGFLSTILQY